MSAKVLSFCGFLVVALAAGKDIEHIKEMHKVLTKEIHLGIDLGTTQSVAAVCVQGNVSVVEIDGDFTVPSTVWFSKEKGIQVGNDAVNARSEEPENVIYAAKRVIGIEYQAPNLEDQTQGLPFSFAPVTEHGEWQGNIGFKLPHGRVVSPEQVGALVLKKLKQAAEESSALDWFRRKLGFTFTSLTVSVPVTFGDEQKRATIRACRMAGFKQVRLIEEPVAAAVAFGLSDREENGRVLVFDIGGGTLDVALLHFNAYTNSFYVEHTAGEAMLGGEDFDIIVAEMALEALEDPTIARSVRDSPSIYQNLLVASEAAKRALSTHSNVNLCVPDPKLDGLECVSNVTLTRSAFDAAGESTIAQAIATVNVVLQQAGISDRDDFDVVLVGGTSRVPAIRKALKSLLPNARVHFDGVDPDQAVAIGAAKSWGCNE